MSPHCFKANLYAFGTIITIARKKIPNLLWNECMFAEGKRVEYRCQSINVLTTKSAQKTAVEPHPITIYMN